MNFYEFSRNSQNFYNFAIPLLFLFLQFHHRAKKENARIACQEMLNLGQFWLSGCLGTVLKALAVLAVLAILGGN